MQDGIWVGTWADDSVSGTPAEMGLISILMPAFLINITIECRCCLVAAAAGESIIIIIISDASCRQ